MGKVEYISYSRVKCWRRCQCEHFWRYVLGLEKVATDLPLIRGQILHNMIEAHLRKEDYLKVLDQTKAKYEVLFFEQQEKYGDLINDLDRLMKGWIARWKDDSLTYTHVELPFEAEFFTAEEHNHLIRDYAAIGRHFPDEIYFVGKIDAIAEEAGGMSYIVEHKTVTTIPGAGSEMLDMQTTLYKKAMELLGMETPRGILWDYIRTKAPVVPEPLQKGGLSVAKAQDTDYATYYDALIRNNLDPARYSEMLQYLQDMKVNAFYKRTTMPSPNPQMIENMWQEFQDSAIQIAVDGSRVKIKNLSGHVCNYCSYFPLCQAEILGNDVNYVMKAQYQKKQRKAEEVV